jgi:hypothetical protein
MMTLEDAMNGAETGSAAIPPAILALNRVSPDPGKSEAAGLVPDQLLAQPHDAPLDLGRRLSGTTMRCP